jgi:hypothetical protein
MNDQLAAPRVEGWTTWATADDTETVGETATLDAC